MADFRSFGNFMAIRLCNNGLSGLQEVTVGESSNTLPNSHHNLRFEEIGFREVFRCFILFQLLQRTFFIIVKNPFDIASYDTAENSTYGEETTS